MQSECWFKKFQYILFQYFKKSLSFIQPNRNLPANEISTSSAPTCIRFRQTIWSTGSFDSFMSFSMSAKRSLNQLTSVRTSCGSWGYVLICHIDDHRDCSLGDAECTFRRMSIFGVGNESDRGSTMICRIADGNEFFQREYLEEHIWRTRNIAINRENDNFWGIWWCKLWEHILRCQTYLKSNLGEMMSIPQAKLGF